jgi:site-specific recombinase XerD
VRLAAIHSFFRYLSFREPRHSQLIQRVLAIAVKRFPRRHVDFLTRAECEALLVAPDTRTWVGQRDHALLTVALQTGLRVSELVSLKRKDVDLSHGRHVRCMGKGRKERCTPLRKDAVAAVRRWLSLQPLPPDQPLFPSSRGGHMSPDAVEQRLRRYVATAAAVCPSLQSKRVSPHVLRHSTAMDMLHRGVDRRVIALWLGHESPTTTQMYLDADMALKEAALGRTLPYARSRGRYRPDNTLLSFLKSL